MPTNTQIKTKPYLRVIDCVDLDKAEQSCEQDFDAWCGTMDAINNLDHPHNAHHFTGKGLGDYMCAAVERELMELVIDQRQIDQIRVVRLELIGNQAARVHA